MEETEAELYKNQETADGDKNIYRITRAKHPKNRMYNAMQALLRCTWRNMEYTARRTENQEKLKEKFNNLLNSENDLEEVAMREGPINQISNGQVMRALGKMKLGKAVRPWEKQ